MKEKMKDKIKGSRENEEREMKEKMKEKMIFFGKCLRTLKLDELAQNVSKQVPFRRLIPPFFFESSESDRVFNDLLTSNSIFRGQENSIRIR